MNTDHRQNQPGNLYIQLTLDNRLMSASVQVGGNGDEDFVSFTIKCLNNERMIVSSNPGSKLRDCWLVHYHFPEHIDLPDIPWNDWHISRNVIAEVTERKNIHPSHVVRLRDVSICLVKNLTFSLKSYPKLLLEEEFRYAQALFDFRNPPHPSSGFLSAVETNQGVMVFSATEQGEKARKHYMQYYYDQFFNPALPYTDFLKEYRLFDLHDQPKFCSDRFLDYPRHDGMDPHLPPIPQELFCPREVLKYGLVEQHYDMRPTDENYLRLIDYGMNSDIEYHFLYRDLLHSFARDGYNEDRIMELEFPAYFSYVEDPNFEEIARQLSQAGTEKERQQILDRSKTIAEKILREKYPKLRETPSKVPAQEKHTQGRSDAPLSYW